MLEIKKTDQKIGINFFLDNVQGMDPILEKFYRVWIPKIQSAVEEYFPANQSEQMIAEILDMDADLIDKDAVNAIIVEPNLLYIERPGKLLRPILTAIILESLNIDVNKYLNVLAMLEFMECTSISLNDIWDDSLFRRNGYCTQIQYGRQIAHIANFAGYRYCYNFLLNNSCNLSEDILLRLYEGFAFEDVQFFLSDAVETMWPLLHREVIDEDHFFQEVISRCAFLSFRGPARIAAILGGVDDDALRSWEDFGMLIGLAYHLRGDNLNTVPQSNTWGKIPYEDVTAGRRSLLTSYAIKNAGNKDRCELLAILDSRTKDKKQIIRFIELLEKYDAATYCEKRAIDILGEAKRKLDGLDVSQSHKKLLYSFSDFMVKRKK